MFDVCELSEFCVPRGRVPRAAIELPVQNVPVAFCTGIHYTGSSFKDVYRYKMQTLIFVLLKRHCVSWY